MFLQRLGGLQLQAAAALYNSSSIVGGLVSRLVSSSSVTQQGKGRFSSLRWITHNPQPDADDSERFGMQRCLGMPAIHWTAMRRRQQ
jgi:hypothetical protein